MLCGVVNGEEANVAVNGGGANEEEANASADFGVTNEVEGGGDESGVLSDDDEPDELDESED